MTTIDLTMHPDRLERALGRVRERGIVIPTFAQMKDPARAPAGHPRGAGAGRAVGRQPAQPVPHHLEERAAGDSGGGFGGVNYLEFPRSLTGVPRRASSPWSGKWFPTGAHKVGAAFGCLVPRLVTGQFDPTTPEGGLALHRQLLPRRRVRLGAAGLPVDRHPARRHEPGALRVAVEDRRRGHRDPGQRVATSRRSSTSAGSCAAPART